MISGVKLPEGKDKGTAANRNKLRIHQHQTLYASSKLIAIEKNFSPREMSYTIIATRKSNSMSA